MTNYFVFILILMVLVELKSQTDYLDHFQQDTMETHNEDFSALKEEDISKITEFIKAVQSDRERNNINPSSYCRSLETCHECIKSHWRVCGWCRNFGCTDYFEKLCPHTKRSPNGNSCPHITHKGPILIPAGVRRHIKVELSVSDPELYNADVICQLQFKFKLTHLKGMILNELVYCYPLTLSTEEYPDTETGTFKLIWGGAQPFSNDIPITVYRCETLALDCDGCRILPPDYGCGWCDNLDSCVIAEKCAENLMRWTVNRLKCDVHGKKLYYVR